MKKIFVSYSSQDRELVQSLVQDLQMQGNTVWFDRELKGGQSWWDQILANIREADLFVFALTPRSLESSPCKLEYTYAYDLGKTILPVLLEDGVSTNLLPSALSAIQFVDYRKQDKAAAFALVGALNTLPESRPLPDPLPDPPPVPISYLGTLREQIETSRTLTYEEQSALILRLKERGRVPEEVEDVKALLQQFRARADLLASVATEIDATLAEIKRRQQPGPQTEAWPRPPVESNPGPNSAVTPTGASTATIGTAITGGQPWSQGTQIALYAVTFFIPLVGMVAAYLGWKSPATKTQARNLLIFAIVMFVIWAGTLYEGGGYYF